jgi:CubicO group peptidase (beta-lactamase class C family)
MPTRILVPLAFTLFAGLAGAAPPAELDDGLQVATPADVALQRAPFETLTQAAVDEHFPDTTSVLVFRNGRLVYERYFDGGGINVLNNTRSVTKTLTALIVAQAISDGALRSGDQPAFELLPDLAPFRNDEPLKRGITLMDLLTMSSALDCNDFDEKNIGNEENMYPLTNWSRWVVDLPLRSDYLRNSSGRGSFSYCTGGVFLLGQVVQRATRKPLDQYFDERLFRPLGIRERKWFRSPSGEIMTGGGLELRSRDLLKLGVLMAGNGNWRGIQLVPAAWVKRMQTLSNVVDGQSSYGMLTWQREYRSPCGNISGWSMSGNGGNVVVNVPLKNLVAVVTRTRYNTRGMHEETVRLLESHVFAALNCTGKDREPRRNLGVS